MIGLVTLALTVTAFPEFVVETAGINPAVVKGLEIKVKGNQVTVLPGLASWGGREAKVKEAVTFTVPPAGEVIVQDEVYRLKAEKPQGWARGTPLRGCISRLTPLPNCLVPNSVVVRLPDGTVLEEGKDYLLDPTWAMLGRIEGGRIGAETDVLVSYRYSLMRLDTLVILPDGQVRLIYGVPEKTCPHPPQVPEGSLRLANIFMPYRATSVEAWQVFVIGQPFREPDEEELKRRSRFVAKTLEKLRKGDKVVIVAWGDSVTVGGDASKPELAFPQLFVTRLRERFPKAQISLVNAGVGGTDISQRLPNLQKEVLAYRPDLVVVEFVNDMRLPVEEVRRCHRSAIDQILATGAEVILITPHFVMPPWMKHEHPRGKETRPFIQVLREVAAEKGVALADVSRRWEHLELEGLPYITLLYNGINHPDNRGHELFVKELMTFFPP